MTQDFANSRRGAAGAGKKPRPPTRHKPAASVSAWFGAGLLCGIFLCGLAWLALQQPDPAIARQAQPPQPNDAVSSGPLFSFYTALPEQDVDLKIDAQTIAAARAPSSNDQFLLQAGSFKQAADADRRRGELILLGLEAHVEESNGDNGRWFRVYIGPFASRSLLAKARSLTAQQGIDTLMLKRPPPKQG